MKTINREFDLEKSLKFETQNGNTYIFCPETCLVFEESKLISENKADKKFNDRSIKWSNKHNLLGISSCTECSKPVIQEDINKHLMQYGFNELILEVTTSCNLRCKYCVFSGNYNDQRAHSNEMMTIDTALKAIKMYLENFSQSKKYNPYKKPSIAFYGGEPLINFELIRESALFIHDQYKDEIFLTLTTNGTLLTDEMTKFLVFDQGFYVIFSVDGPEDVHDQNRVFSNDNGTFRKVMENIRRFVNISNRPVYVNSVYDYSTDIETVADFFENNQHMINLSISPVNPFNTSYYNGFEMECINQFRSKESKLRSDFFAEIRNGRLNNKSKMSFLSHFVGRPAASAIMRPILNSQSDKLIAYTGACVPGEKIMVGVDGTIYPCEKINRSSKIGHIDFGLDLKTISILINDFNDQIVSKCQECPVRKVCGYCYNSFSKDGKFFKDNALCQTMINSFTNNLSLAYSILENDPAWFDNFSTTYYQELREMVVRLK